MANSGKLRADPTEAGPLQADQAEAGRAASDQLASNPFGASEAGADKLEADEVRSMVVDSQSKCIGADEAEELVERNYAAVYRYAFRLAGCAATAEDITQEVFVKAIAHLDQLRSGEAERGWLLAITRREFMRWLRQVARPGHGRPSSLDEESVASTDGGHEAHTPPLDNQDWVQAALSQLNEDARVALLMYYFEDLSYAQIAQQLQIPIGTVMSRLSRGREHLRQGLERLATPQSSASQSSASQSSAGQSSAGQSSASQSLANPSAASPTSAAAPIPLHPHLTSSPITDSHSGSKPAAQEAHHG